MSKNDPAFPEVFTDQLANGKIDVYSCGGMTMRQWYKGQAIMGIIANPNMGIKHGSDYSWTDIVKAASLVADAALVEDAAYGQ